MWSLFLATEVTTYVPQKHPQSLSYVKNKVGDLRLLLLDCD